MEQPSHKIDDKHSEDAQKMIGMVTRMTSVALIIIGGIIMATDGDMILGGVLFIIGLVDLVLLPRVLEKVMIAKLKQRQNSNRAE